MRFQKLRKWLNGPGSDYILYAVIIVLVNIIGLQAYLRFDLTARKTYSLSEVSKQAVQSLEEPLSVNVFFSPDLPAPYNNVELYIRDLMGEYGRVGNPNFSYEFYDMEKEENKTAAQDFGIYPIQVQQVMDDELQVVQAYMGLSMTYGDSIEQLNNINYTDGLEYDLTTTMQSMVMKSDALSGLPGKVQMTLYRSRALEEFNISGFGELEQTVYDAYVKANLENFEKLEYNLVDPVSREEINSIADRYGLQRITWTKDDGSGEKGTGILGIVLEYEDGFTVIPLSVARGIFGGFGIQGLDSLYESVNSGLEVLTSSTSTIAYLIGNGEKDLNDSQQGAGLFQAVNSDIYEFREVNVSEESIPENIKTLVINGPLDQLDENTLYSIDQFLMRGGSIVVFLDPFREIVPQQNQGYGSQPVYLPLSTGLEGVLESYGVKVQKNYILDTNCYIHRQQGAGEIPLYYVPIIAKDDLNQEHSISQHLTNIAFIKTASLETVLPEDSGVTATVIASSSSEAWLMSGQIQLDPYSMRPPPEEELSSYPMAVLLEGRFNSYFDGPLAAEEEEGELQAQSFLSASAGEGKIFVIASSALTTPQLLDEEGRSSNSIFIHNILDYMNGNPELNEMRSKGLSVNPLDEVDDNLKDFVKYFNMAGIPALIIIAGLIVWQLNRRRREKIQLEFLGRKKRTAPSAGAGKKKGEVHE